MKTKTDYPPSKKFINPTVMPPKDNKLHGSQDREQFKRIIVNIFTQFNEPKEKTNNHVNEFREQEYTD